MSDLLYTEARQWVEGRSGTFTRRTFQRHMMVGFVTRDRLLLALEDAGLIRRVNSGRVRASRIDASGDTFEVTA